MPAPKLSRDEFAAVWRKHGGKVTEIARELGLAERNVYDRRVRLEAAGYSFESNVVCNNPYGANGRMAYRREIAFDAPEATAVVFGDMHSQPLHHRDGDTPAMAALLLLLKHLQPTHVIDMGDSFNGGAIGRHPPLGWEKKPDVQEELVAVQHDKRRIADAHPSAVRAWVVGNHDERYDRVLAQRVSEFGTVAGFRLADHFPTWPLAWSITINRTTKLIHRWHGGVHARHNNILKGGGGHLVTADTHRLGVTTYTGQFGVLYGVECGTLADPAAPEFEYTRGVAPNWQPGFVVLTWRGGKLQPPELCYVDENGAAWFRGEQVVSKPCKPCRKKRKSDRQEA